MRNPMPYNPEHQEKKEFHEDYPPPVRELLDRLHQELMDAIDVYKAALYGARPQSRAIH